MEKLKCNSYVYYKLYVMRHAHRILKNTQTNLNYTALEKTFSVLRQVTWDRGVSLLVKQCPFLSPIPPSAPPKPPSPCSCLPHFFPVQGSLLPWAWEA